MSVTKATVKKANSYKGVENGQDNPANQYSPLLDREKAARMTMNDRQKDFDEADAAAKNSMRKKGIKDGGEQNKRMSEAYKGEADTGGDALRAKQNYDRMTVAQDHYQQTKKKKQQPMYGTR